MVRKIKGKIENVRDKEWEREGENNSKCREKECETGGKWVGSTRRTRVRNVRGGEKGGNREGRKRGGKT